MMSALAFGSIWLSLAAIMPRPTAGMVASLSTMSKPLVTPRASIPTAQYGYGGGQQGQQQQYGQQQQQYGQAQQGYGAPVQQGPQALWVLHGAAGVKGMAVNRFKALPKYWTLPYTLMNGEEQVLSRWNMQYESTTVSRMQCLIRVLADGTPTLTSTGKAATLWRMPGGPWNPLYKRQQIQMTSGIQISLDPNNPEGAVFTAQQEDPSNRGYYLEQAQQQQQQQQLAGLGGGGGYPQQQGGYPQQQGGYPQQQQGGYPPQQGGYPQQGGGYPPQQQGGGYPPQQGGY